ncbi:GHKL domain-containing protein [Clostridium sp. 19966]|nr:ATP-binding protein [Clostridium sp. 19966]MDT8715094.1 GHKL domain-containing protein [Clostridium sp. 19966]
MKVKSRFERKVLINAILIAIIPIVISYIIFLNDKITSMQTRIKSNLYNSAVIISEMPTVGEKLSKRENDRTIQNIVKKYIGNVEDLDLVVIADMTGEKYSHNDEKQIGQIFVGEDKKDVLEKGIGYYSIYKGSLGVTYRRFQPIFYNNKQVGFIMTGKYYKDIQLITRETQLLYFILFIFVFLATVALSRWFAKSIKKSMLNMEPEEIAKLYKEKKVIINSISDGIIALDENNKVVEVNNNCYTLFKDFSIDKIIYKIKPFLEKKEFFDMKEMRINGNRVFVTLREINGDGVYLGAVITIIDKQEIKKIAKEITGIDEVVKDLRASIHEFKNKLHVILGLMKIEKYKEARKYILDIQEAQDNTTQKYSYIEDYYIRAMFISREIMARERGIKFILSKEASLWEQHGPICNDDIITVLGNLIENSFEACVNNSNEAKEVEVYIKEDAEKIYIEVSDNGEPIPQSIREKIFERGISSKREDGGIGLSLVKTRADIYEGSIEIEELEDRKNFRVTLFKEDKI